MPRSITIELPGIVIPKAAPRFIRKTGVSYTEPKTHNYMNALSIAAHKAMNGQPLFEGPLRMTMMVTRPILLSFTKKEAIAAANGRKFPIVKPDLSNYLKAIEDAFNCVVFKDDAQIVEHHNYKRYGDKPGLRVDVEEIDGHYSIDNRSKRLPAQDDI